MGTMKQISNEILDIKGDIQTAIESKGQTVTDFASFPNAIMNISGGGPSFSEGDIKLFNSVEALNNDPDKNEGDLACVYTEGNLTNFYEYKVGLIDKNTLAFHDINNDTVMTVDGTSVSVDFLNNTPLFELSDYYNKVSRLFEKMKRELNLTGAWIGLYLDNNNNLKACILFVVRPNGTTYEGTYDLYYYSQINNKFKPGVHGSNYDWSQTYLATYNIDLDTCTYSQDTVYNQWKHIGDYYHFLNDFSPKSYVINIDIDIEGNLSNNWCMGLELNGSYYSSYKRIPNDFLYRVYDAYVPISLSMTADEEFVLEDKFLGKNGVKTGLLQNTTNLTRDQIRLKTNVWVEISNLTLDSNITDISELFKDRIDLVEIPSIDLTNITNMTNTFLNCPNLNERAYATITNMLPVANQLSNQYISNMGLNINNFTYPEMVILNEKGYTDAVIP